MRTLWIRLRSGAVMLMGLAAVATVWAADSSMVTPTGQALGMKTVTTGAGTIYRQEMVVCDATTSNCMPSGDTAARGIYVKLSDVLNAQDSVGHVVGKVFDENSNGLTVKYFNASPSASGNNQLIAAVVGKKLRVLSYSCQRIGVTNVTMTLTDGDGGATLSGPWALLNTGDASGSMRPAMGAAAMRDGTANTRLTLNLSAAVQVTCEGAYVEVT